MAKSRARRPAMRRGVWLESDWVTEIDRSASQQITGISSETGYTTMRYLFASKRASELTQGSFRRE